MKKMLCFLTVLLVVTSPAIAIERHKDEIKDLHSTAKIISGFRSADGETVAERIYYDEENDNFVFVIKENVTKSEFDKLADHNPNLIQEMADNCKDTLCKSYGEYLYGLGYNGVNLLIKHISNDGELLYCMANGGLVADESCQRSDEDISLLTNIAEIYSANGTVKARYVKETDAFIIVSSTPEFTKKDLKDVRKKEPNLLAELADTLIKSLYKTTKESMDNLGIMGLDIIVEARGKDDFLICQVVNGKYEE